MAESNIGKWNNWYRGIKDPQPYGDTATYRLGADFLQDCDLVEDWGCGKGWFSRFISPEKYRGIDGSHSPWAENIVDLVSYQSQVPGIYMRHVLEHNYEWESILRNALASFTQKMVLVLFTPLSEKTHVITFAPNPGVPDISFSENDLITIFNENEVSFRSENLNTATQYGVETIYFIERS